MTDDENHYTELQEVYNELISRHEEFKTVNPKREAVEYRLEGRRKGLIESISEIEELLNEWNDRDDRDG